MKKTLTLALLAYCLLPTANLWCQVKVVKATSQKVIAGMGGVFMEYSIEFKDKKNGSIEIDSVKSLADNSKMTFSTTNIGFGQVYYVMTFSFALQPSPKCKTCVETTPPQPNMTKGIIIYYKRGEKKSKFKVKEFTRLEDAVQP